MEWKFWKRRREKQDCDHGEMGSVEVEELNEKELQGIEEVDPMAIEASVLEIWKDWRWDYTGESIVDASPYAQYLFGEYYFFIPAVNKYYLVQSDGNYYHGYETEIRKESKTRILEILHDRLQREGMCPYRGNNAEEEARWIKRTAFWAAYYKEKIAEIERLP